MRVILGVAVLFVVIGLVQPLTFTQTRLTAGVVKPRGATRTSSGAPTTNSVTEAPAGYDNISNGYLSQSDFDETKGIYEERDDIAKGLGPVYNAQSCAECHQSPTTGGISQISVLRAGHLDSKGNFVDAPGGSLINDRAIDPAIQEVVPDGENIRTFRASLNTLGDGYVEAIDDSTFTTIAQQQAQATNGFIQGQVVWVQILEDPGLWRVGRFGWKDQHASLLSFSGDAYVNEIGITNRLFKTENTSLGRSVAAYDMVPDNGPSGEDKDNDIDAFAAFMRATKPPSRDWSIGNSSDSKAGENLFNQVGCNICHMSTIPTASPDKLLGDKSKGIPSLIPGINSTQAQMLGNKNIHPYSDFLLHDVGTGDGIVQNGGQITAHKMRTSPLWGLRTHNRYMHDFQTVTLMDAIMRHGGEASQVINNFSHLNAADQKRLITFLRSL
ncbi:MAG TPA: di-heme oxidoredictase family protein [Blastocatellia bacterium]|nr:di-heme oxidoredictase family protein [Blastocatellia bacterium]